MRFGVGGDESEVDESSFIKDIEDKTPTTKRKMIKERETARTKKLGTMATAFTLLKGFVATGVLYIPQDFVNGGYVFSPVTILLSLALTLYCAKLLIEVY